MSEALLHSSDSEKQTPLLTTRQCLMFSNEKQLSQSRIVDLATIWESLNRTNAVMSWVPPRQDAGDPMTKSDPTKTSAAIHIVMETGVSSSSMKKKS